MGKSITVKELFAEALRYSKSETKAIVTTIFLGMVRIGCSLLFVALSKRIVDIATKEITANLNIDIALLVAVSLLNIALTFGISKIEQLTSVRIQCQRREKLFNHLLSVKWMDGRKLHSADLINRLDRDIRDVSDAISKTIPNFIVTLFQFLASFIFLTALDNRLAVAMVLILPIFILCSKIFYKKQKKANHQVRENDSKIVSDVQDSILNSLVIRTLGANSTLAKQLSENHKNLYSNTKKQTNLSTISRALVSAGFMFGYIAVFGYGVKQLEIGAISYGVLIAFLQLVGQIQQPVSLLASFVPQFITAATALERIEEVSSLSKTTEPLPIVDGVCGIRVSNLNFSYENRRTIIKNLNYDFKPNSATAIVGITGAGKSTLLKLLLGLLEPQSGKIEIYNETSSWQVSTKTIYNFIYVPQNNSLFTGTIKENLLLGCSSATDKEIEEALYTAAAEFVYTLPEGLETMCGEKGDSLSQGQAQRVSIARSLLGKGSILLLDEATSALDSKTRELFSKRLTEKYPNKTVLFVTHQKEVADLCNGVVEI